MSIALSFRPQKSVYKNINMGKIMLNTGINKIKYQKYTYNGKIEVGSNYAQVPIYLMSLEAWPWISKWITF